MRISKHNDKYDWYIANSPYWQEVTVMVCLRAMGTCEYPGCNRPGKDTHHLRYEGVLYHELEGDNLKLLRLYCRRHHRLAHPGWTDADD